MAKRKRDDDDDKSKMNYIRIKKDDHVWYKCKLCEHGTKNKQSMIIHIRIHTGEKPFECEECNASFVVNGKLMRHARDKHKKKIPFRCRKCNQTFFERADFIEHGQTHPKEGPPFKCKDCDKVYTTKAGLMGHIHNHTGKKRFKCNVCQKTFPRKYALKNHMLGHVGKKPQKCNKCGRSFTTPSVLDRHIESRHLTPKERKAKNLRIWCHSCWKTQLCSGTMYYRAKLCKTCFASKVNMSSHHLFQKIFFLAVKDKFQEVHPDIPYLPQIEDDYIINGNGWGAKRRRPDQGWRVGPLLSGRFRFIDGEFDENSHRGDDGFVYDCEIDKMLDTNFGSTFGKDEVIFLRVGLDYRHTSKEFEDAVSCYVERLVYWLRRETLCEELYVDGFSAKVGVEYLNYKNDKNVTAAKDDVNVVVLE